MAAKKRTSRQKKPSKEQQERSYALTLRLIEAGESLAKYTVVGLAIVASLYVAVYLPIEASAGRNTTIVYVANFLADIQAHVWLSWGATGAAVAWGHMERRKRLKERDDRDSRIAEFEKKLDPSRTSSNLTVAGDTKESK